MKIAIIGTGYVGLVTGACFADLGNSVICVDNDRPKIHALTEGDIPIYEPGLEELVAKSAKAGRLSFTADIAKGISDSEVIFICVGTPPREDGSADLTSIENVSREIAANLHSYKLIVEKSTVPVETGEWVKRTVKAFRKSEADFDIASNPEFLREGSAIHDFLHPDRIVVGAESVKARKILEELYRPLKAPIVFTGIKGAEIIKHASNSFLATKISFINAVANICEKVGVNVEDVAKGIGLDPRINMHFLRAGAGFGGFCFPKDLSAFMHIADSLGYSFGLLKEVEKINEAQKDLVIGKVKKLIWNLPGKTIGVLGLSFKPNTDDIRFSPSIAIVKKLLRAGCKIKAYDPGAMKKARKEFDGKIAYCGDAYEAVQGANCMLLMTEWNEFRELDFLKIKKLMAQPVVVDARNIYDPAHLRELGFEYEGIGRG